MRTVSIANLKGGVGKSITTRDLAYNLSIRGYKVLILDNDKQGDSSRQFNRRQEDSSGTDAIMTEKNQDMGNLIQNTDIENIDIITTNMKLINANKEVMMDCRRPQHDRIKKALEKVQDKYDFCIIDNAPDINISVINALVASEDVIIPVEVDDNTTEGLDIIVDNVFEVKNNINPYLEIAGVLITKFDKRNSAHTDGVADLQEKSWPLFDTKIRVSKKVAQSQQERTPITLYSRRCAAAVDYMAFTEEYLKRIGMQK